MDRQAFIQTPEAAAQTPRFQDWRVIGAQALATGRVDEQGDRVRVEFRLWDVLPETQLQGTAFTAPAAQLAPHRAPDLDVIYERLLGEKGYFDTRVVYISRDRPARPAHPAPRDHGPGRREPPLPDRWPLRRR